MSLRTPVSSTRYFLSQTGAVDIQSSDVSNLPSHQAFSKSQNDSMNMTTDELFTKYTVVEVKAIQTRLRADADAKREELRLMVGERYRDLLQASSAIMSISKLSTRVLEAIEESKLAILSQDDLPLPPKFAAIGINDKDLTGLQILSTHIKLLLDAPEHLWRLIERKKYLHAAWLFLLSRVTYRVLITHDEDEQFRAEEIEAKRDFPLVQRQWEVVGQFRSQVIHKATLSLRDISMSTEDICAALVSLNLLDSRPLNEILDTFLLQRSKRLQVVLSWKLSDKSTDKEDVVSSYSEALGMVPIREITQVMKDALNTIVQTICTSRVIFHAQPDTSPLLLRVLDSIQLESSDSGQFSKLPSNLHISTPTILSLLASPASFQFLAPNVRSYRPYIDLGAYSASLTQSVFIQKLQEWLRASCERWQTSSSKWLSGLNGAKEVWTLRTSIKRLVTTSHLSEGEKGCLSCNMDTLCHDQIVEIWRRKLSHAEDEFKLRLRSQVLEDASSNQTLSTSDFLFTPTPISPLSQSKSSADMAFQKYQLSLKRQLVGRSPQLDSVLSILEDFARTIQHDFSIIKGFEEENIKPFVERLEQTYQPAANSLSSKVTDIFEDLYADLIKASDSNSRGLVFLSRAVDSLVSSSSFIDRIHCSEEAVYRLKERTTSIGNKAFEEWRIVTVKRIVNDTRPQLSSQIFRANGPSNALLHALLALAEELKGLGIVYHRVGQRAIVEDVFRHFFSSLLDGNLAKTDEGTLHDLAFLRAICELYGTLWNDLFFQINQRLKSLPLEKLNEVASLASDHLVRSQTLLSILLPVPTTPNFDAPLLQFGIPAMGQNYTSAADFARPSPRFGMLLVGKTET